MWLIPIKVADGYHQNDGVCWEMEESFVSQVIRWMWLVQVVVQTLNEKPKFTMEKN